MKTLRVEKVEVRRSKTVAEKMGNEGRYHVVTFSTSPLIKAVNELGESHIMKVQQRRTTQTAWYDSPIPGREVRDYGATLEEGDIIPGDIVQREVEPYFIQSSTGDITKNGKLGRMVTTASVVVFGDNESGEDWRMAVLRSFKQRNFFLVGQGNAGAPGGNLASALNRPQTKLEGHDPELNLPKELQGAEEETQRAYSDNSSVENQDQGNNAR